MKARRKRKPSPFVGLHSHYLDYRYGEKRPVYVPGKGKPRPILNKDKHKHLVDKTAEMLGTWQRSKFEQEGATRAGLRSGFCMNGYDWHRSDAAAAQIVAEALNKIGAKRPTWEEGQHRYVEPRENCAWCGNPVEDGSLHKAYRFCSDMCARSAFEKASFEQRSERDRTWAAAYRMIKKARNKPRKCEWCGGKFLPVREAGNQRFCSTTCGNRHSRANTPTMTRSCDVCGQQFETTSYIAEVCSKACSQMRARLRTGYVPRQLKRHVFDHFFTLPLSSRHHVLLTPERFDQLVPASYRESRV